MNRVMNRVCSPGMAFCPLYTPFLNLCKGGNLEEIRRFHDTQIEHHPCFSSDPLNPKKPPSYSQFMGTVYCNLDAKRDPTDPVQQWFHQISTEIHSLY